MNATDTFLTWSSRGSASQKYKHSTVIELYVSNTTQLYCTRISPVWRKKLFENNAQHIIWRIGRKTPELNKPIADLIKI